MYSLMPYKQLSVINTSSGSLADGGGAINDNFKAIADQFQGVWNNTSGGPNSNGSYPVNSIVTCNGATYIAISNISSGAASPPNASWSVLGEVPALQALTPGSGVSWNMSNGNVATLTLGSNATLSNPINLAVGTYTLIVTQGGTGSWTLSFESSFFWPGSVAPVLSTAPGAIMF
jgi:hypothetical protein